MANKTRTDIINQVYEYVPTMNVSSHDNLLDNLIALAAEEISMRHNFRYLVATAPATHDAVADEYYVDHSDFTFTNFKEIKRFEWIKSATGEYSKLIWMPTDEFLDRFPYPDYSSRTSGKPTRYTRIGTRYMVNCPVDEVVTWRIWYQKYHGAFADDDTSHSFDPNMLGFQAIVASVLAEIHNALPGLELSPKVKTQIGLQEYWINKLIAADISHIDEPVEMQENKDAVGIAPIESPYGWAT